MGKVKAQLLDEQEHDQFMRDQEPDFDDYALAMKAKDKDTMKVNSVRIVSIVNVHEMHMELVTVLA